MAAAQIDPGIFAWMEDSPSLLDRMVYAEYRRITEAKAE